MAEETKDTGLPLGDIALDLVRTAPKDSDEKYIIHRDGPKVIKAAVNAVLLSEEPHVAMAARFKGILVVCYVLEVREGCPNAARQMAKALLDIPEVKKIMGSGDKETHAQQSEYRRFLDDKDMSRAPKVNAKAPDDSVKASSFINPGQDMALQSVQPRKKGGPRGDPRRGGRGRRTTRNPRPTLPPHARKG